MSASRAARSKVDLVIVGRGRVGRTLLRRATERGLVVRSIAGRSERLDARSRAALTSTRVVWITVPDPHVPAVEARLAVWLEGLAARHLPAVAHASGSLSPEVLDRCRALGAPVATAHPIVSFGTTETEIVGATFLLAGEARATRVLSSIVRALGGRPLVRALPGPRYHAALALLANGAAALADRATSILVSPDPGLSPLEARRALGRLLRSVADNVERVGAVGALTGPIVRGDVKAIERHLAALDREERADYVATSQLVLRAASSAGLDGQARGAIAALLDSVDATGLSASRGRRAARPASRR